MYTKTTEGVTVKAMPQFLADQSDPAENRYVWAYTIQVENHGTRTIRLMNRYWHITDALGRSQEVRGPGVVGEQPVLKPGEAFRYTSGVPLSTPSGIMVGEYEMVVLDDGEKLMVDVPAFSLESPFGAAGRPN